MSTDTVPLSGGCARYVHGPSLFEWLAEELPNSEPPREHPPPAVC